MGERSAGFVQGSHVKPRASRSEISLVVCDARMITAQADCMIVVVVVVVVECGCNMCPGPNLSGVGNTLLQGPAGDRVR